MAILISQDTKIVVQVLPDGKAGIIPALCSNTEQTSWRVVHQEREDRK